MPDIVIKDLAKLLQPSLGGPFTIAEYETKRLTANGENYGSLMLQLLIKIIDSNGSGHTDILNLVAKLCPPNEWIKKVFHFEISFKKEVGFYNVIVPTIRAFQKEQGVLQVLDCVPECYGARTSLDPKSEVADDDTILLLENLKLSGFEVVDRMKGFDYETTKLLLKDLATFHAIPIAIKLLRPELFKKNILPHLGSILAFDKLSDEAVYGVLDVSIEHIRGDPECEPLIARMTNAFNLNLKSVKECPEPREPFATINHNDYWVNNSMVKFEHNKPIKNKIVDFQLITYGSPGNDIVFLLLTSVQKSVLNLHYEDLVQTYYDSFIDTLKSLKCDTALFTFELLQEEIAVCAKTSQFFHVLAMLMPIFASRETVKDITEISEEDMVNIKHSEEYGRQVAQTVLAFAKRGWI